MKAQPGIRFTGAETIASTTAWGGIPHLTTTYDYKSAPLAEFDKVISPFQNPGVDLDDYRAAFGMSVIGTEGLLSMVEGVTLGELNDLAFDPIKSKVGLRLCRGLEVWANELTDAGYHIIVTPLAMPFEHELIADCSLRDEFEGARVYLFSWKNIVWRIFVVSPHTLEAIKQATTRLPVFLTRGLWRYTTLSDVTKSEAGQDKVCDATAFQMPFWLPEEEALASYRASLRHEMKITSVSQFPIGGKNIWAIDGMPDYGEMLGSLEKIKAVVEGKDPSTEQKEEDLESPMRLEKGVALIESIPFGMFLHRFANHVEKGTGFLTAFSALEALNNRRTKEFSTINPGIMSDIGKLFEGKSFEEDN